MSSKIIDRIGEKKLDLYNQYPPGRAKDTNTSEIENTFCVRSVMNVTPVFHIEREPWGDSSILKVNYVVYICTCSVRSNE